MATEVYKNHENSLTRGSVEQFNTENIFSVFSYVVLLDVESIHPCAKYSSFASMCGLPNKYIKLSKWSCVLIFCIKCPSVFVPDVEMNNEDDADHPFVIFHH